MKKNIILCGAGAFAEDLKPDLEKDYNIIAIIVDKNTYVAPSFKNIPIFSPEEIDNVTQLSANQGVTISGGITIIGNNKVRKRFNRLLQEHGFPLIKLISPKAEIASSADIGPGVIIRHGAIVEGFTHIAEGAIINTAAIVCHHAQVGRYAFIAPGAIILGSASVKDELIVYPNTFVEATPHDKRGGVSPSSKVRVAPSEETP